MSIGQGWDPSKQPHLCFLLNPTLPGGILLVTPWGNSQVSTVPVYPHSRTQAQAGRLEATLPPPGPREHIGSWLREVGPGGSR